MAGNYQFYDAAFKETAVLQSYHAQSISQLSRMLDIRPSLLYRWREKYEKFGTGCFCGKGKNRMHPISGIQQETPKKCIRSKRRFFDSTFKEQAVQLSYKPGTFTSIEKEHTITPGLLARWRREYEKFGAGSFKGSGITRISPEELAVYKLEKHCRESELQYEILKKAAPFLIKEKPAVYLFIKKHENSYPLYKMCGVLGVSESTYRLWREHPVSEKKQHIAQLKEKIKTIFFEYNKQYGGTRLSEELKKRGTHISRTQVSLYMKEMRLRPKAKRKYKATTDSKHNNYTSPNVLNQNFTASGHSQIWVSDITYIQTSRRFLYLTIIMDLYDRKIVGWNLSSTLSAERTSLAAWTMAEKRRQIKKGLVFHSDRGVQYACRSFTSKLDSYNCVTRSMSRRGNHFDNAAAESFFNTIKRELIYHYNLLPKKQLKELVGEYIENWYNKNRIHSSLRYKTIEEFNAGASI
ncbi:transposase InsO family protein [Flavobacterium sp. 270]|uniref:IS3 family transposase n=1 Tax=Flavobacterium sp. 270 TaxID=2512114 RepID=UPI00106586C6|nr:IS3 family transposase [Flavobacterium sp. 270]TDW47845.1 transposase InsO family protein [Flavobacterium sp. 270]